MLVVWDALRTVWGDAEGLRVTTLRPLPESSTWRVCPSWVSYWHNEPGTPDERTFEFAIPEYLKEWRFMTLPYETQI